MGDSMLCNWIVGVSRENHSLIPMQAIKSIRIGTAKPGEHVNICGLIINGTEYGKHNGTQSKTLFFSADEYINDLQVGHTPYPNKNTDCFHYIKITTNLGRTLEAGAVPAKRPDYQATQILRKRIYGIGGAILSDKDECFIAQLEVQYSDEYEEPVAVGKGVVIIDIIPPFTTFETYSSSETSRLTAVSKMMEKQFNSSVEAETSAAGGIGAASFSARVTASTSLTSINRNEMQEQIQKSQSNSTRYTQTVPEGYVGLEVSPMTVYNSQGYYYMYPTGATEYICVKIDDGLPGFDIYDMTGALGLQMPGMIARKTNDKVKTYGFDFYPAKK